MVTHVVLKHGLRPSNLFFPLILQLEGEETPPDATHRRESERGLLDAALADQDEEGLQDGLATPPLQHSPSWSVSRSRINSCRVKMYILDFWTVITG